MLVLYASEVYGLVVFLESLNLMITKKVRFNGTKYLETHDVNQNMTFKKKSVKKCRTL